MQVETYVTRFSLFNIHNSQFYLSWTEPSKPMGVSRTLGVSG